MLARTKKQTANTRNTEVSFHLDGSVKKLKLPEDTARQAYGLLRQLEVVMDDGPVDAMNFVRKVEARAGGPTAVALRVFRRRAGLSQVELAKAVNMHATHLSLMETGKRKVTPAVAKKLAVALNCDWQRLCVSWRET